jgi:hypothetical protein
VAFKVRIDFGPTFFSVPKLRFDTDISASEKETKEIDAVAMSYLAYLVPMSKPFFSFVTDAPG